MHLAAQDDLRSLVNTIAERAAGVPFVGGLLCLAAYHNGEQHPGNGTTRMESGPSAFRSARSQATFRASIQRSGIRVVDGIRG